MSARKETELPAQSLRCRSCAAEYALDDIGTCTACFGPLDPVYDWDALAGTVTRASIAAGPASIWRYAALLPVEAPENPRLAPGLTPLVPADRLAEELGLRELWLKLDTANPTHSFKDRVVAVGAQKARELGRDTLACSSTGNLAKVATARATDGAIYAVPETEVGENMAVLAAYTGVFGETAAGVSLGALREAVARGELGANDRVVLVVTGDGLKTPGPVSGLLEPVGIEADADAVLERLGVLT
jgi:threonine synthase